MPDAVDENLEFLDAMRARWRSAGHEDEFVLLRSRKLIGFFPAYEAALTEGYARYGNGAFTVQPVAEHERADLRPAYALGLLSVES